jgi:AraC family transcriptional regulator
MWGNAIFKHIPKPVQRTFGMPKVRLNRALAYIEDHLGENIRVNELTKAAGISLFHFAKLFKKTTGRTSHKYMLQRRIEKAKICSGTARLAYSR